MFPDQFKRRRNHLIVIGKIDSSLLQIDVQPIKTIDFRQSDNFSGKRLFLTITQLNVGIGAPQ
ncbi:hypothetical protein D3C84_690540 [compost metagenome]